MADERSMLDEAIRSRIATAGPMPVAQYMALCLVHPEHGYYMRGDPFGRGGDFITAPEISQMFGELIGVWAAAVWSMMGSPRPVRLVELGPGRGTMISDALRASRAVPEFRQAITLHLVEASPVLQQHQRRSLQAVDVPVEWHASLARVPDGPAIVFANEFFDALPIHQAVKQADGWHERVIEIGDDGRLVFGAAAAPMRHLDAILPPDAQETAPGAIFEWRSETAACELARRIGRGGAALVIDYGHVKTGLGDTFQAVRAHRFVNPLADPGLADLTAHVDFQALASSAERAGARVHGPIEQAVFLRRLGIEVRALALKTKASPAQAVEINAALARLTAGGPTGMGALFKVLGLADPKIGRLPGFETSP
jgi:SAM-dependent MidA family methyltransferase